MRLLFTFLAITIGFVSNSQTNVYHSIDDNLIWRVDVWTSVGSPWHCGGEYHFHYYLDGDTLISGELYKKLYRSYVHTSSSWGSQPCFPWDQFYEGYVGAIRDDSLVNKVFFYNYLSTSESLLYDYNFSIGDTIVSSISDCGATVTNIDSVQIAGSYRKRWHFDNCSNGPASAGYIIQGYGSSSGLIERLWSLNYTRLICIRNENETIYETGLFSPLGCKEVYLNTHELSQVQLTISPIPANKFLKLNFQKDPTINQNEIQVINSLGSLIDCNYNPETRMLDVSNLTPGVYYIKLFLDKRFISKRFVIAK